MNNTEIVKDAIETSVRENRIVRIAVSDFGDVLPYVENHQSTSCGIDCWGRDDDGDEFRILVFVEVAY
jgi:hypothetical protein